MNQAAAGLGFCAAGSQAHDAACGFATPSPTPYRVLIVDDCLAHRTLQKEVLSTPQYAIDEAGNGEEALRRLESNTYDVVLLDNNMPGLSGIEVCRRVRGTMGLDLLPIIMVTARHSPEELAEALRAGATDFISKPYHHQELIARVDCAVRQKRKTDGLDDAEAILFALARMVEAKDEGTGEHCNRLSHIAVIFGGALGLGYEELDTLRRGGVLHDIGKLGVPDAILLKGGPLTPDEWSVMRQHTVVGAGLCGQLPSMKPTLDIIRHHHERWDGSGYPDGLKGEDIPLLARVFQIVDIYDALTNERPYKEAFGIPKALAIMEQEVLGGSLDPRLFAVFADIVKAGPSRLQAPNEGGDDSGRRLYDEIFATGVSG